MMFNRNSLSPLVSSQICRVATVSDFCFSCARVESGECLKSMRRGVVTLWFGCVCSPAGASQRAERCGPHGPGHHDPVPRAYLQPAAHPVANAAGKLVMPCGNTARVQHGLGPPLLLPGKVRSDGSDRFVASSILDFFL